MTNKLENVKAAIKRIEDLRLPLYPSDKPNPTIEDFGRIMFMEEKTITEALTIYQAILENRVLLVPVEPSEGMLKEGDGWVYFTPEMKRGFYTYKAMTQAVDQDELLKEILG